MSLENYISDLLYRYECVTVPGLGAFITQKTATKLDTENHVFYPPSKKLTFNTQLQDNDGVLAQYIADAENIGFSDALKAIQTFTQETKINLHNGEAIVLDKIGTLALNKDNKIIFEPANTANYLTDAFGLASHTATAVKHELYKENIEEKTTLTLTTERRNAPAWIKYAAVGLVALGLSGTLGYVHLQNIESHNVVEKQKAEDQIENTIQKATFTINNPLPAITLNAFKPEGKYHIIAGAFRIEENAQKHVDALREKGFMARQIGANKYGLHQVVYGSYADRIEALQQLRSIRAKENSNAWMLVKTIK